MASGNSSPRDPAAGTCPGSREHDVRGLHDHSQFPRLKIAQLTLRPPLAFIYLRGDGVERAGPPDHSASENLAA